AVGGRRGDGASLCALRAGARGDRVSRPQPERHAPDGAHPALPAARRARSERGQHPARDSDRGAEPPPPRGRGATMSAAAPRYLDYAATTPVDPAVAAAMSGCLTAGGDFANPSSTHAPGMRAAARIEAARAQVAALIGAAPDEIVFTSGATESDNLGVLGVARANADRGRHVVSARTEHKAVLDPCKRLEKEGFSVTYLSPSRSGVIEPEAFAAALRPDTVLASIMYVNNEIGVLQDVAALGALCRERGIAFHSDCAQAAGKVPLDMHALPVDFVSVTAHKLYGPKGVGALYVRRGAKGLLQPLLYGGGQERSLRPGTLATHQIVGFGVACEIAARELPREAPRLTALRALGRDTQLAQSSLRFGLGRFSTESDVEFAAEAVRVEVRRLRALSPAGGAGGEDFGAWQGGGGATLVSGEGGGPGQETWVRF